MKKPFYFYGDGKSPSELRAVRGTNDMPYLVLPLSKTAKDFLVEASEYTIKVALDSGIKSPLVIAVAVLDNWLKLARGDNVRERSEDSKSEVQVLRVLPPPPLEALIVSMANFLEETIRPQQLNDNEREVFDRFRKAYSTYLGND